MKRNQRTVKIYDATHAIASRLSFKRGVSMAAVVEMGIRMLADEMADLPDADPRARKANTRRALGPDTLRDEITRRAAAVEAREARHRRAQGLAREAWTAAGAQ